MSAEVLREAAALMRERAEAATPGICPEWTRSAVRHIARNCEIECWHADGDPLVEQFDHGDDCSWNTWDRYKDAPHIASWHPAVALAVADWLDATAAEHEADSGNATVDGFFNAFDTAPDIAALAVARAYLASP